MPYHAARRIRGAYLWTSLETSAIIMKNSAAVTVGPPPMKLKTACSQTVRRGSTVHHCITIRTKTEESSRPAMLSRSTNRRPWRSASRPYVIETRMPTLSISHRVFSKKTIGPSEWNWHTCCRSQRISPANNQRQLGLHLSIVVGRV